MEFRHHRPGNGRGPAPAVRHASHASPVPDPAKPTAQTQVQAVELQVQELHRDRVGQGLPPAALHRQPPQALLRQRPAQ